jgi:predicted amidohydrolase YtcJ
MIRECSLFALFALAVVSPELGFANKVDRGTITPIAFVDVTVLPMNGETVLQHQTVLVQGDRITRIGPFANVKAPASAIAVDGRHQYLMPGLVDFHDRWHACLFGCGGFTRPRLRFTITYKTRGDWQTQRKSHKTDRTVGWVVGWEFLGKTALKATLFSSLFPFMYFRSSARRSFPLQFDLIVINGGTDEIF